MSSRHRDRSRSRSRDRHKSREKARDRDKDRDRDRDRRRSSSKRDKERDRSRSRERHKEKRRTRSKSRGRKSKDRDGTIALLDQMVGTTTKRVVPVVAAPNPVAHAAILAAAAVAQTFVASRRISAPIQPAAAAAAALSAATAIPPPSAVQAKLSQLRRRRRSESPPSPQAARRRTRWAGADRDKTFIPGLPTVLPACLTPDQEEQYLLQLQIEEVSRKLRSGDLGIPANVDDRSPSPEPIYSTDGKRLNTREYRTRRKLEEERHRLVSRMNVINPEFKPPADYKPPIVRVHDKVMIPQEEHPDINFVGLLIGPRGNTLKAMEKETGAKIIIRGKGSVKEGKVGRKDGQPLPGEDEPLHAYITATSADCVKKAVDKIRDVIRQGVEVPEGQNDLRRMQLRELAQLNGTLREHEGPRCSNCGGDHKAWLCPDRPNVTAAVVCSSCGGKGHIARDCRHKRPGHLPSRDNKIDQEYLSLMAELGESCPPGGGLGPGVGAGGGLGPGRRYPPPLLGPRLAIMSGQQDCAPRIGASQPPPPGAAPLMAPPPFMPPLNGDKGGPPPPPGPPPPHMPPPPGMMGMPWRAFAPPPWAPPPFLQPPPPPPPLNN